MQRDERLVELVGLGSEAAFEAIVHRYRGALLRHCARLLGDADADEAVQETLVKAHRALAGGASVHSLGAWLHAIAHNSALTLLAGRRAGAGYREDAVSVGADHDEQHRERLDALVGALLSLPERQRQAVVMREFEGRSYDEIATRLGASNGAVRQLLNRARASIRERLGALVPVELVTRWMTITSSSNPSRALTLAGSGALAAKISGAVLLSAAPVVAVAPVVAGAPVAGLSAPARHEAKPSVRVSAGSHLTVRVSASALGSREPPAAVRAQVDQEREHYEEPFEAGHVVSRTQDQNAAYASVVHGSRKNPSSGRTQLLKAWLRTLLKIHSRSRTSRGEISASRASRQGIRQMSPPRRPGASPKRDEARGIGGWKHRRRTVAQPIGDELP